MRNIDSFSDKSEEKERYRSILSLYLLGGVFVYLYSIPNIFFVYIDDIWRLFDVLLCLSYFVVSAVAAFIVYRLPSYERLETNLLGFTVCLWSMVESNLYGIQALVDQPFYQELYIDLLLIQLFLILFSLIKWIPVRTRERIARIVTIILGSFFIFHLLGIFASTKGMGIYVFLFGKEVAVALIWPGIALFFSGFWTHVTMAGGIDLGVTPKERARMIAEE
ncbi:MAG TPA: hypothetical protein DEO65_07590 [Bacillus bacterium]|uniref:hypothetical protein n=1 Tax=Siminovitchia fordii TaxID=254759 RepID=UPI000379BD65|nr:hypothetical protein [Siminovitchia fordii]HBZ09725.1 hypothetical protein [Bacillus sp. (in: firmicutes)]